MSSIRRHPWITLLLLLVGLFLIGLLFYGTGSQGPMSNDELQKFLGG